MKKIILILLFSGVVVAQNSWQVVKEATLGNPTSRGFFLNENSGWLFSENPSNDRKGVIYHTGDGGLSWIVQRDTSILSESINDVYFYDATHGWACGDGGVILRSTDGGSTWVMSSSIPTSENLKGINFVNNSTGYACGYGGVILRSDDGGNNWVKQNTPTFSNLNDISFFDANNGFAVFGTDVSGILWTNSGGFLWSVRSFTKPPGQSKVTMYDCKAVRGTSHAWMIGYHGNIFHSTNKGQNWSLSKSIFGTNYGLARAIDFIDANTGFAGSDDGWIYRTIDSGVTWDSVQIGTGELIYSLNAFDANTIITTGAENQIRKSTDGGNTWTPIIDWPRADFRGVGLADSSNISFYTFGGDITYSNDAGNTFSFPNNVNLPTIKAIEGIEFYDANIGFYGVQLGQIAKTIDGGTTWYKTNVTGQLETVRGFSFYDQNTMWACARYGIIYKSTDGGENWTQVADLDASSLYAINFLNDQIGYTAGEGGKIYKCTDGGINWTEIDSVGDSRLHVIEFLDNSTGFVVGYDGIIGKTNDGGNTWDVIDTLGYINDTTAIDELWDIEFVSSTEGWIGGGSSIGENGVFYHTTDAGNTWNKYDSPNGRTVRGLKFISPTYGWAAGAKGSIFKYDISSGIDENITGLLNSFELYSNYPNPFNPGTNIEYYLNISGNAILSIYDIQGRKIRTLVEENQNPGSYHYYWDSKNENGLTVSSGTYFYQLEINNEIHAKRMIFIK